MDVESFSDGSTGSGGTGKYLTWCLVGEAFFRFARGDSGCL